MFYRQTFFTILTSTFLLGAIHSVQAMNRSDEESSSECSSSSFYHLKITAIDRENFRIIESSTNFIPETNADLDEIQLLLKAPIKAELSFGKYLYLKNPDEYEGGANRAIFIATLENGIKVFIKRSMYILHEDTEEFIRHYDFEGASPELVAPKMARAFFDTPTLPPTELVSREGDDFEVRQFFIKGALPEEMDEKWEEVLYKALVSNPQYFNRSPNFFFELSLFDDFIAAADRNSTNYLWVPYKNTRNKQQVCAFFAIDYQETNYNLDREIIIKEIYDEEIGQTIVEPLIVSVAPLSVLKKLEYLHKIYPSFIEGVKDLHHSFRDNGTEFYGIAYLSAMATWQKDLFKFYQGNTIDDTNAYWWAMVNSHELNKK